MTAPSIPRIRSAVTLVAIALVALALPTLATVLLRERIQHQDERQQLDAFHALLPAAHYDNQLLRTARLLQDSALGGAGNAICYFASQDGQIVAVFFSLVASDGYNGDIDLLIGISRDSHLLGVQVLAHHETPGLGEQIASKDQAWLQQQGTLTTGSDTQRWALKTDGGDIDQISGATVSSRAVVGAVRRSLQYFQQHRSTLLLPSMAAAP